MREEELTKESFVRALSVTAVSLLLLVLIAFQPAMLGGFVWDDATLMASPALNDLRGLAEIWTNPRAMYAEEHYWPVVYSTFWLQARLWNGFQSAFPYHLFNILLHAANAFLLWLILQRFLRPSGAWTGAAIFALHPVHVESVAWVIELKDVLSGFFYLLAVFLYISSRTHRSRKQYVAAVAICILAMLTKSVAITLPAALLLVDWILPAFSFRASFRRVLPFVIIVGLIGAFDFLITRQAGTAQFGFTLLQRMEIAGGAFWMYLEKLIFPWPLIPIYPRWEVTGQPWGLLMVLAGLAALGLLSQKIGRGPVAGFLYYFVALAPTLGFISFSYMQYSFVADRYQYLASAGPIAIMATGFDGLIRRGRGSKVIAGMLAAVVIFVLGALTFKQCHIWRTNVSLFGYVAEKNPKEWFSYQMLGFQYARDGVVPQAIKNFKIAAALAPDEVMNHTNLAILAMKTGNTELARETVAAALLRWPDNAKLLAIQDDLTSPTSN